MTNLKNVRDALEKLKNEPETWTQEQYNIINQALSELEAYMENDGWSPIEKKD